MTRTNEQMATVLKTFRQLHPREKLVFCLGCFDLLHPGHLRHFQAAKKMGDILVVAVTSDRYVNKGPDRPVFNQDLRVEMVSALMCVDFAFVNDFPTGVEAIRALKPDVFVKGQEFESGEDPTGRFQKEIAATKEVGCEVRFTHEVVFSSTKLIEEIKKEE